MLEEIDSERAESPVSHVIVPIGVGSLGQAVARHSKTAQGIRKTVISVEPDTAACLWKSLEAGKPTSVETNCTIMSGLNCGTLSANVWSCLSSGIDASVTVSDFEAHEAVQYLLARGLSGGPCGGATLAALKLIARTDLRAANLTQDSVVVLLCTEGARGYATPIDVASDDPVELTQKLVCIDSSNRGLSLSAAAWEAETTRFITAWLEHRDIETHWIEPTETRSSVVGNARGPVGGKYLMFNGDTNPASHASDDEKASSNNIIDQNLHRRDSFDMKSGLAASMIALARGMGKS